MISINEDFLKRTNPYQMGEIPTPNVHEKVKELGIVEGDKIELVLYSVSSELEYPTSREDKIFYGIDPDDEYEGVHGCVEILTGTFKQTEDIFWCGSENPNVIFSKLDTYERHSCIITDAETGHAETKRWHEIETPTEFDKEYAIEVTYKFYMHSTTHTGIGYELRKI